MPTICAEAPSGSGYHSYCFLLPSDLDWDVGQPNGGETQNFVSFKVKGSGEKSFLGDDVGNIKQCAYCSVPGNIIYAS